MGHAELARQRELNKYYQPWLDSASTAAVPEHGQSPRRRTAHSIHDTTLKALAQLAALRLNVKRGVISLIDEDSQYILAEATQTLPLVGDHRHAPGDDLWLGTTSLPRKNSLDNHVFGARYKVRNADASSQTFPALVVHDLEQDERFRDHPSVASPPNVRFYAGVPIVTRHGHEIGVYAVSDSLTRPDGLSADEVMFMEDVAEIVAEHLERVKSNIDRDRGEGFVKSIASFIEGLATIKHKVNHPANKPARALDTKAEEPRLAQATDPENMHDQSEKHPDSSASAKQAALGPNDDKSEDDLLSIGTVPKHFTETEGSIPEESDISDQNLRQIFSRASTVIREGVRAEGCVFLAASSTTSNDSVDNSSRGVSSSESDSEVETSHENTRGLSIPSEPTKTGRPALRSNSYMSRRFRGDNATVLGMSLAESSKNVFNQPINMDDFRKCFHRYPYGKYFSFDRGHVASQSLATSDRIVSGGGGRTADDLHSSVPARHSSRHLRYVPRQVLDQIPDAKWLVFLPLYNHAQQQWFSGAFIWSSKTDRSDAEVIMPYLKTFGSCIMSEVAGLEAMSTSVAKTTFIASISHDLRSPLHGMLGSLEFLEDTMTTAYQLSLLGSIETCGKTLLDTIDHLLDYAKINNLNQALTKKLSKRSLQAAQDAGGSDISGASNSKSTPFDLALLVEEVTEAVFAGQTFRKKNLRGHDEIDEAADHIRALTLGDSKKTDEQIHSGSAKFSGKVFFIVDTQKSESWYVVGQQPGALRRIILNVVGNAIKYCSNGCIEVALHVEERGKSPAEVQISVNDTGIGMSQDFLQNHLFKAFSQEDSFTPGTGLGLSITRQLVDQMGGNVQIRSERGVGTHVTISIPMHLEPRPEAKDNLIEVARRVTEGKRMCLLTPNLDDDAPGVEGQLSKLQTNIAKTCEEWFGMSFVHNRTVDGMDDVSMFVYAEPPPIEYLLQHHSERKTDGKSGKEAALLIICTNAFEAAALRAAGVTHLQSLGRIIEVISQPVGVRKMATVLLQSLQRVESISITPNRSQKSAKGIFRTGEAQQRAETVKWNSTPVTYDETSRQLRPAVSNMKWKSEQSRMIIPIAGDDNDKTNEFGQIKAGILPGNPLIPSSSFADVPGSTDRPPSVLVVDDNAINLKLLVTFMKRIKLPYAEAVNGLEAFTKYKDAKEQPFEFVLMDLQMPVMDGLESTRKIREYEKESNCAKPATIIAITGVGNDAVRHEAMDSGMSQFLTKPIKFKALQQILELRHRT